MLLLWQLGNIILMSIKAVGTFENFGGVTRVAHGREFHIANLIAMSERWNLGIHENPNI
jgi:hypothetical protein